MKINELKNIINFAFCAKEKEEKKPQDNKQIEQFSCEYASATKAMATAQISFKEEKTFEQKQEELIEQLASKDVFDSKEDVEIFVRHYVSEDNYHIASRIFDEKRIPPRTARAIVKRTYCDNAILSEAMVFDKNFPAENIEDILLSSFNGNILSALAAIKNKNIAKEDVSGYLRKINFIIDPAASHILGDENLAGFALDNALAGLNPINAVLIEEIYSLFEKPNPSCVTLLSSKTSQDEVNFLLRILRMIKEEGSFDSEAVSSAIYTLREYNEKEFVEMFNELTLDKKIPRIKVAQVLSTQKKDNHQGRKSLFRILRNDLQISKSDLMDILQVTTNKNAEFKALFYQELKEVHDFPKEYLSLAIRLAKPLSYGENAISNVPDNFVEGAKIFKEIHKNLLKNPELYINGENQDVEKSIKEINDFVETHFLKLCAFSAIFDKDGMELLFRTRLENVEEYMDKYSTLQSEPLCLNKIFSLNNKEGKTLNSKEKIELFDLLYAMSSINMPFDSVKNMEKEGKIDIEALQKELFFEILKDSGLSQQELDEIDEAKLKTWNLKYISHLAQESSSMSEDEDYALDNIIYAACCKENFKEYIQSDNKFGWANALTREAFKQNGLNFEAWFNPSKSLETNFSYIDSNQERMSQVISQIEEDIETLRKTPARGFIDKHYPDCLSNGKFKINEKYCKNKETLETFARNLYVLLDKNIFARAQKNIENPDKKKNAQLTLTIKNHLEQRLNDISQCEMKKKEKPVDLTIKMWDRIPQKDLFQGNYSTCCIGLGQVNGSAMPHYLTNAMFNMIELVDNYTGQTIGNALCYFITNEYDEPVFVIDNIEIANAHKMSNLASSKLLNEIIGYCINLLKTISGQNIQILMGTSYNDVYDEEESSIQLEKAQIIGEMECDSIYLDVFGGWEEGKFDYQENAESKKMELIYLADSYQDEYFFDEENLDDCY